MLALSNSCIYICRIKLFSSTRVLRGTTVLECCAKLASEQQKAGPIRLEVIKHRLCRLFIKGSLQSMAWSKLVRKKTQGVCCRSELRSCMPNIRALFR